MHCCYMECSNVCWPISGLIYKLMCIFHAKFNIIPFKCKTFYILKLLTKHIEPYWLSLAHSKYANSHLDQTLLWSSREIRAYSLWNLWEASIIPGSLLRGAPGCSLVGRGLITVKGRMEKPSWKSHGLCREGGKDGWAMVEGGVRSLLP